MFNNEIRISLKKEIRIKKRKELYKFKRGIIYQLNENLNNINTIILLFRCIREREKIIKLITYIILRKILTIFSKN